MKPRTVGISLRIFRYRSIEAGSAESPDPLRPSGAGERALKITTPQLEALRTQLADGAKRAAHLLQEQSQVSADVAVGPVGLCLLADFPAASVSTHADCVAGALHRIEGDFHGTLLAAMDPEDALRIVRATPECADPIARYLEVAALLAGASVESVASMLGVELSLAPPALREDTVTEILLATHAPSDTLILSWVLEVALEERSLRVECHSLVEPKLLENLSGVEVSSDR